MPITDETRRQIFDTLKKNLETVAPPMVASGGHDYHDYQLLGNKPVSYGHDKKIIPGMFFAAVANRKDSVTFHFFPCYMDSKLKSVAPSLYKCLKGKTCFHFKKTEQVNEKELKALLKEGVKAWKKMGYMK
ncbi:MAG TPA: hypothetical protein DCQ93_03715 [Bacteroidetes bacterium]|nr:hypothetical protein [Bacteroidota bacterium]